MISKSLRNWVNKTFIIIINKIGEGAYSTVYKVKRLVDGNVYALKKVKLLNLSEKEKLNALNEVRILASVKSNFVISYKEAFFDDKDSTLGIVMEYADSGDLYQTDINIAVSQSGSNVVTFTFSGDTTLHSGEAIQFGYICNIDKFYAIFIFCFCFFSVFII